MSIEELTKLEEILLAKMPDGGYLEERHEYLVKNGLYLEWQSVFEQYVELALEGNTEALKRAVFFLWYQTCEPSPLSGLTNLSNEKVLLTLEYLNELIGNGKIDSELNWMLLYYYQIAEWYIPNEATADAVLKLSSGGSEEYLSKLNKFDFVGRGQLGEYWRSIQL